jgi:hypothetical protein
MADTLHLLQLLCKASLLCSSQNIKLNSYALARKSRAIAMNLFQLEYTLIAIRMK